MKYKSTNVSIPNTAPIEHSIKLLVHHIDPLTGQSATTIATALDWQPIHPALLQCTNPPQTTH